MSNSDWLSRRHSKMLHAKPTWYRQGSTRDDYWKLEHYSGLKSKEMEQMLKDRGYDAGSRKSAENLSRHLQRADLGLRSYVKLQNSELKDLISKRRPDMDVEIGNKREDLIDALEYADYHPEFDRFTELPPELRAKIYAYYFAEFEEALVAPKQPPLTRTSRMVRREALPLFYSSCTFELPMRAPQPSRELMPKHLAMGKEVLLWLHSTSPENLADIQHIEIEVLQEVHSNLNVRRGFKAMKLSLDFYTIDGFRIVPNITHNSWTDLDVNLYFKELAKLRHKINSRENGCKLEKEDFFALRRALEGAIVI